MRDVRGRTGWVTVVELGWVWETDIRLDQPCLSITALHMGGDKSIGAWMRSIHRKDACGCLTRLSVRNESGCHEAFEQRHVQPACEGSREEMIMMLRIVGLVVGLTLVLSIAALADWNPGDGHKMHYPQLPIHLIDPGPNGMDVAFEYGRLADDWECMESGDVTDIHFWVSWLDDLVGPIDGFTVVIWSDNPEGPDGYSIPNEPLWSRDFGPGDFVVRDMEPYDQDWFNPWTGDYRPNNHTMWQQINIVDIWDPFHQEEGNVYWLEIDMWGASSCGWKVSGSDQFRDDAVCWDFPRFMELIHPITFESLDLAFVITCEQWLGFGWEDLTTVLGLYGDGIPPILATNVGAPDPVYSGLRSLRLEDASPSGTPQAYLAWVRGLQDGDVVEADFWRYDVTPGASPSCRIWGHWNDTDSCTGYSGSAGGNDDYGPGTGWDKASWSWVVVDGHTGLIIECRTYSNPGDVVWVDDIGIRAPCDAIIIFPDAGPSAVVPTTWSRLKAMYR